METLIFLTYFLELMGKNLMGNIKINCNIVIHPKELRLLILLKSDILILAIPQNYTKN